MQQLTIYIGETDHVERKPLYLKVLELVQQHDCAGATVLKGLAGYSASGHAIHTAHLADFHPALPLVITVIDEPQKLAALLPTLEEWVRVNGGVLALQEVDARIYRREQKRHAHESKPHA